MRSPIKYALGHEGVSNTDTKEVYYTNIFTHYIDLVKRYIKRVLRGATPPTQTTLKSQTTNE